MVAAVGGLLSACSSGTEGPTVADIEAIAGDQQSGVTGSALAQLLVALVTDPSGQPVPGVAVTWTVTGGSATAAPTSSVSDGAGQATTTVTLGNAPGVVTVQASAGSYTVNFTATAVAACDFRAPITLGAAATNGSLAATDCHFVDGSYIDHYSLAVPAQQAVRVHMAASFDTYLFLAYDNGDLLVGVNDDETQSSTNSDILAVLAPGTYVVSANSYFPAISGNYTLTATSFAGAMANCDLWFLTPGITLNQTLAATDCDAGGGFYTDFLAMGIEQAKTLTLTMTSTAFDAFLRLRNSSGTEVASNDNGGGGTNASITYTTTAGDFYIIEPTSVAAGATGAYTLTITGLTAAGAAAPAPAALTLSGFASRRKSLLNLRPRLRSGGGARR